MSILKQITLSENEAADFGFKWENPEQILQQITSEIAEIRVHLQDQDRVKLQEEIGDLLHAVFSLTVFCQFDPEETLTASVNKFMRRLKKVKALAREEGLTDLNGKSFAELMAFWDQAKRL